MRKAALLVAILVLISVNVFAKEVVTLAIGEWAPYTSEKNEKGKLLEKIVAEAFSLEGIEVKYEYYPWKRSYEITKAGKADGTFPWNRTEEREKDFFVNKEVLIKDEGVYFHLKSKKFEWDTIEDLKKYKIGVTLGYKNEKIYKENRIKAAVASSEELNFKLILLGRIDVYQTSKIVGYYTISSIFKPEEAKLFTHNPKIVSVDEEFILFSRKTPNGKSLSEKFDSGLKKLKESGKYDEIIAKFLGSK